MWCYLIEQERIHIREFDQHVTVAGLNSEDAKMVEMSWAAKMAVNGRFSWAS